MTRRLCQDRARWAASAGSAQDTGLALAAVPARPAGRNAVKLTGRGGRAGGVIGVPIGPKSGLEGDSRTVDVKLEPSIKRRGAAGRNPGCLPGTASKLLPYFILVTDFHNII